MAFLRKHSSFSVALVFLLLFVAYSCTTEKNTGMHRAFHNLTSHYNVYFNGNEAFKRGEARVYESYQDNYTKILPVFPYDDQAAKSADADMDRAIEKAQKVIKKHSITKKPKRKSNMNDKEKAFFNRTDFNKWIDDAYLLMGKGFFYKREYIKAAILLQKIPQRYAYEDTRHEALLWLARVYTDKGDYASAVSTLTAANDHEFPKRLELFRDKITVDLLLRQERYKEAIPRLRSLISNIRGRRNKARFVYILAQIYEKQGDNKQAAEMYKKVSKMNPSYEMTFNAQINRALLYSGGNSDELIKQLNKMLRDDKNIDYQDQIYYALANIAMKAPDTLQAINNYQMSVRTSTDNNNQKALSCLALADIYFNRRHYEFAQAYYDSTVNYLDSDYPSYQEINLKANFLTELVDQKRMVAREDSLQRVARMSESERESLIQSMIAEVQRKKAAANQPEQRWRDPFDETGRQNFNSSWPFDNPTAMARGNSVFRQKWGNRKLEDHWRRKNKAIVSFNPDEDNPEAENKVSDDETPEYYLQDLPLTDSAMQASDKRIIEAMFREGEIYYEDLADYEEAIRAFEVLNNRFPNHPYLLESYYNLYLLNRELGNAAQMDNYKEKVIARFPNSLHAKMFTDPDFMRKYREKERKAETFYEETFSHYKQGNYKQVVDNYRTATKSYPHTSLMPQFTYLKALAIGNINGSNDLAPFKRDLQLVVDSFPNTTVAREAEAYLSYLDTEEGHQLEEKEIYLSNPQATHFYVIVSKSPKTNINRLQFDVTNFNNVNYTDKELQSSVAELTPERKLITVKQLENKEEALAYFQRIRELMSIKAALNQEQIDHFVISADNFTIFFDDKRVEKYLRYFQQHY